MKMQSSALLILSVVGGSLVAEEVCHKCELIREENKKKICEYEFYEDFIKAHPEAAETLKSKKAASSESEKPSER